MNILPWSREEEAMELHPETILHQDFEVAHDGTRLPDHPQIQVVYFKSGWWFENHYVLTVTWHVTDYRQYPKSGRGRSFQQKNTW